MVNPKSVYRKTEAGIAEVQVRTLGLRAELRRLLILIDGTATLDRLAAFVRGSEIDFLVAELEYNGLVTSAPIAPIGRSQPAVKASAAGAANPPSHSANAGIEGALEPTAAQVLAVRRVAIHMLHEILGPDADSMAVQIERCKNSQIGRAHV